jgi:glycosyltransferase involved in cell wall biosynthesis
MRVLLVSPVGVLGGAEQVFLGLARHLPRFGVKPIFAVLRPGPLVEEARAQGVSTYAFREHRFREWLTVAQGVRWLAALARSVSADVLHSNFAAHLYGGPAALMAGVPELWQLYDYPHRRDAVQRLIERFPSQHVIFATNRVKSGFPRLHARSHSVIAPTCVEPERLQGLPSVPGVRTRLGLPEGPLFLTVARIQEHKGHRHLIDAVPKVLQSYPEAIFAIAGRPSGPEQERYQGELRVQAARLGVAERVRFLGYVPELELVALYREASALVHPATSEGFGLILLEAMALGAPVIAASADGPGEIVTPEVNGLLVPTRNAGALAQAMCRLLADPVLAERLSRNGRDFAGRAQIQTMVRQTVEVYEAVCGSVHHA